MCHHSGWDCHVVFEKDISNSELFLKYILKSVIMLSMHSHFE